MVSVASVHLVTLAIVAKKFLVVWTVVKNVSMVVNVFVDPLVIMFVAAHILIVVHVVKISDPSVQVQDQMVDHLMVESHQLQVSRRFIQLVHQVYVIIVVHVNKILMDEVFNVIVLMDGQVLDVNTAYALVLIWVVIQKKRRAMEHPKFFVATEHKE